MARPKNLQDTDTVEVTLPVSAIRYLQGLAKGTMLGATVPEVASFLLKAELEKRQERERSGR